MSPVIDRIRRLRHDPPILVLRRSALAAREWNAFVIGRDYGAMAGPSPEPERHIRLV